MQFRVLGSVDVQADDGRVHILPRRHERCLLAVLLLEATRMVSLDRLSALLWEERPPERARRVVQSYVARIRAALAAAGGEAHGVALVSDRGGYRLLVDPALVDAHRFRDLVGRAAKTDELSDRDALLREALALWRGPALHNAASDQLRHRICADLEELRLHAVEESMATGIALGRHRELSGELARLSATHPTRERLTELQMLALYRAGRTADALEAYARTRTLLADQFGLDPDAQVQRLHQAILRGEVPDDGPAGGGAHRGPVAAGSVAAGSVAAGSVAAGSVAAGSVAAGPLAAAPDPPPPVAPQVPRCLPADIGDFTGRSQVLDGLLTAVSARAGKGPLLLAVDGMPGVGKTALAVHLAHRVADRFPDGQLALDLHGHSQLAPVEPVSALDVLLRQLGVPGERIPDGLDARVALWRSELAGRRVLVLLDNAAASEQVRPLLPAGAGCLTLVTSRNRLAGLDGAQSVSLETLSADESVALLHRIAGDRVTADPVGAAEVARRCGHLALALRLAAARLSHRPGWTVRDLAARLGDSRPVLAQLAAEGRSVPAAFGLSYDHLSPAAQRLFRLLGLPAGPHLDSRAAAALAGLDLASADALLGELVDAHLLDEPAADRYVMHDLIKEYATDLVTATDPEPDRHAAVERLLDYYLHTAAAASQVLEPTRIRFDYQLGDPPATALLEHTAGSAVAWYEAERPNIVAAVRSAAEGGWSGRAWRLTRASWFFLYSRGYYDDCIVTHQLALHATRHLGDDAAAATLHNYVAACFYQQGRWDEALGHVDRAIAIRAALGDRLGQANSIGNRGRTLLRSGRYAAALEAHQESLRLLVEVGASESWLSPAWGNVGLAKMLLGDLAGADECFDQQLGLAEEIGDDREVGAAYAHIGSLDLRRGRFAEAIDLLERAVRMRVNDDQPILAEMRCDIGSAHRGLGDLEEALHHQRIALATMEQQGAIFAECDVRIELATTLHLAGADREALDQLHRALRIAERLDTAPQRAQARAGIAAVRAARRPLRAVPPGADADLPATA